MCKVYTGYCGTSEIEHGLFACTVDNPLAKARGLSLRTGAQTMLYLSLDSHGPLCNTPPKNAFLGFFSSTPKLTNEALKEKQHPHSMNIYT